MSLAALLLAATAAAAPPADPLEQIVLAERAFAADSPVKGLHGAFLAHLSGDSVLFRPKPTPGRAVHEGKPPVAAVLSWAPAWVAAAGSGDFGVSTGPWAYRANGKDVPDDTGWFFSVWTKRAEGWKVRADIGVSCPLTFVAPSEVARGPAPGPSLKPETARRRFAAEDARLNREARAGLGAALAGRLDEATRVYREGTCPATGEAAKTLVRADVRKLDCRPEGLEVAASGDMGFSYGTCSAVGGAPEAATGYLRVWRIRPDRSVAPLADVVLALPESK